MTFLIPIGAVLAIAVLSSAAAAQPSFDCSKADGTVENMICEDTDLATADSRLAGRYAAAMAVIDGLDAGAEDARNTLRAEQRGWIKGRNDCWKATDLRACVQSSYLTREGELVAMWMLEEPTQIVSYTCDDSPANEVTAFFFDTNLPSVRLEYGDSIKPGSLVPAASGAKYALPFGGTFWTKENEALFAWTEGQEMSCIRRD